MGWWTTRPGGQDTNVPDGYDETQGKMSDAAWVAGDGTVVSLLKKIASGGGGSAVSIADGSDVAEGATTDAAVVAGAAGTVSAKLRRLSADINSILTTGHPVTGTVAVTGPLTDAQLRASTVPVSGTVATGALTDTQLRASAVPVSMATQTPDVTDRAGRLLGVVDTELPAAAALSDAVVNPTTPMVGGGCMIWDSTLNAGSGGWLRAPGTVAAGLKVQSGQLPAALAAGGGLKVEGVAGGVAQPVSGTFFQSAQPVTDNAGSLTVDAPVGTPVFVRLSDGAAAIATLPVSLATNTPDVTDRAARLLGIVDKGKIWDGTNTAAVKAASAIAVATDPAQVTQQTPQRADAALLCITNTAATGVACTLTLPAAAAGLFHYISFIEIGLYATAARTGGATPILVTTTNLPGSPVWDFDTAQAIGAMLRQTVTPATPIKSSVAATATTIVAPIATTGIWRITAFYYTAP